MRARAERFGALIALDEPPALLAVDRAFARSVGIDGGALWEGGDPGLAVPVLSGPTEVHLAVTERCPAGCSGCYADAKPRGHEPTLDDLCARLDALSAMGAFHVAFGGGEGALREDIGALAAYASKVGLTPTLTTSGIGIDDTTAERFTPLAQVNVSYDGVGASYAKVRGYDGRATAERAIAALQHAGVRVGANMVLTRHSFEALGATAEHLERLGVFELQLLRFKPSGRGQLDYLAQRLSPEQVNALPSRLRAISVERSLGLRVDCALLPFLAGSGEHSAEDLARFGVMGCEAGRSLMAVRARGHAAPCSFWQDGPATDTVGPASWETHNALLATRSYAEATPAPCNTCSFRSVCRGGCRIVAQHLGGSPWAPDPECPRVVAFNAQKSRTDAT